MANNDITHRDPGQSGQALVEAAIVMPLMLFVFLCLLQLMLMAHGRVMLEYAAFNATRAGVVHNGNRYVMRNAAMVSLLPLYGPTHNMQSLAETYAKAKAWAMVTEGSEALEGGIRGWIRDATGFSIPNLPAIGIVDVWPSNPKYDDFSGPEMDLDLPAQRTNLSPEEALRRTRLTTQTTLLFELKVPLGNRLLFYSWFLWQYMRLRLTGSLLDPRALGSTAEDAMNASPAPLNPSSGNGGILGGIVEQQTYFQALRALANLERPKFMIPMTASYSMPAESNLYREHFR